MRMPDFAGAPAAPHALPRCRRRVLDRHNVEVGHVLDAHRDPRTHGIDSLVVQLSPQSRLRLGAPDGIVQVPMRRVFGLRRDEVTLDCLLEDLGPATGPARAPHGIGSAGVEGPSFHGNL